MRQWISECVPIWRAAAARGRRPVAWPVIALVALVTIGFGSILLAGDRKDLVRWWDVVAWGVGIPLGIWSTVMAFHVLRGIVAMRTRGSVMLAPALAGRMRRAASCALLVSLLPWLALAVLYPRVAGIMLSMLGSIYLLVLLIFRFGPGAMLLLWIPAVPGGLLELLPGSIRPWLLPSAVSVPFCLVLMLAGWRALEALLPRRGMSRAWIAVSPVVTLWFGSDAAPLSAGRGYVRRLSRAPGADLRLVFGPGMHHNAYWLNMTMCVAGAALLQWLSGPLPPNSVRALSLFLVLAMALLYYNQTVSLAAAIRRTAGEQSLFRLTPGAPRAGALNAVLARQIAGAGLAYWLITCAALAAVAGIFGARAPAWLLLVSIMLAMLIVVARPLRDYAHDLRAGAWRLLALGLAVLALFALSLLALHLRSPLWLLAQAGLLALALGVIAWRWRAMRRGPVAFPALRLQAGRVA